MHDIKKRGPPCILGKDHIHPFESAKYWVQSLEEWKQIDLSELSLKIEESYVKINIEEPYCD